MNSPRLNQPPRETEQLQSPKKKKKAIVERRGEAQDGSSSTHEARERDGCHGGATV